MALFHLTVLSHLSNVILAACSSWFFCAALTHRWNKFCRLTVFAALLPLFTAVFLLTYHPFLSSLLFLLGVPVALRLWFRERFLRIAGMFGVFCFCAGTSDLFAYFLLDQNGLDRATFRQNAPLYALMLLLSSFLLLVLLYLTVYLLRRKSGLLSSSQQAGFAVLIAGHALSFYIINFPLFAYFDVKAHFPMFLSILIMISLVILSVSAFFLRRLRLQVALQAENRHLASQIQQQFHHYSELQDQVEAFRKLRHDILNHAETLRSLSAAGQADQAAAYLSGLKKQITDLEVGQTP